MPLYWDNPTDKTIGKYFYRLNDVYIIIVLSSWPIFTLTYINIQNIILIHIYILQTSMKHYFSSMTSE